MVNYFLRRCFLSIWIVGFLGRVCYLVVLQFREKQKRVPLPLFRRSYPNDRLNSWKK